MVPPETPSFNNDIYIVFDINHSVNMKFFLLREGFRGTVGSLRRRGFQGEPWFP